MNLVLDAKILSDILKVPTKGFETYVRRKCHELGEKEDSMYLTNKYTNKREK